MLYHITDKINLWPNIQLSYNDVNVTHVVRTLQRKWLIATIELANTSPLAISQQQYTRLSIHVHVQCACMSTHAHY